MGELLAHLRQKLAVAQQEERRQTAALEKARHAVNVWQEALQQAEGEQEHAEPRLVEPGEFPRFQSPEQKTRHYLGSNRHRGAQVLGLFSEEGIESLTSAEAAAILGVREGVTSAMLSHLYQAGKLRRAEEKHWYRYYLAAPQEAAVN